MDFRVKFTGGGGIYKVIPTTPAGKAFVNKVREEGQASLLYHNLT